MKKTKEIYLILVVACFIIASLIHGSVNSALATSGLIKYYLGLLFMMVPTIFFFYVIKNKIKKEKRYLGFFLGFVTGVLIILVFAIIKLITLSTTYTGIPVFVYWIVVFLPTIIMITMLVLSITQYESTLKENTHLIVWIVAFTIFMLSTMKGFYLGDDIWSFSAPFLKISYLISYAFTGSILYALTFIAFLVSTFFKYNYLDLNLINK